MGEMITIQVADSTGTKRGSAKVPALATADQVQQALVEKFELPKVDAGGRPVSYHLRNARTEQNLGASETIGTTVNENDKVELLPEIIPGTNRLCSALR